MKPRKPILKSRRVERFVASLLASLTLGHITADERLHSLSLIPSKVCLRKPSFILDPLYVMQLN